MYPYVHIFGAEISTYTLACIAACLCIPALVFARRKHFLLNVGQAAALFIIIVAAGYIGCHALFLLENPGALERDGWNFRGVSFFGCLLFAPAITVLLGRIFKIPAGTSADLLADIWPPFLGIGRIGCYLTGCCGGIPRLLENGRIFVLPVQLIESGFDFLIFAVIMILEKKHIFDNFRLPVYFMLYAPVRFVLEFLRKTEKNIFGFSFAQIYSVAIFIVGAAFLLYQMRKTKKTVDNQ